MDLCIVKQFIEIMASNVCIVLQDFESELHKLECEDRDGMIQGQLLLQALAVCGGSEAKTHAFCVSLVPAYGNEGIW